MSDSSSPPRAKIRRPPRVGLGFVWIVPIIAAAVGAFLFYKSQIDVGPTITITFEHGTNIGNGAQVRYRGVKVGEIESVALDPTLRHVNVRAQLERTATDLAREGSKFWIVEPRIRVDEITGLNTLLSGSYLSVEPGDGARITSFTGLAEPPVETGEAKGLALILETGDAGSLEVDAPVFHRGLAVGAIAAMTLAEDDTKVRVTIEIERQRAHLVRANSVFWQTSGVHVRLGVLHPSIDIGSLESLVRGGISFATPADAGEPASANAVFQLSENRPEKVGADVRQDGLRLTLTADRAGLPDLAPVYYRDLPVGHVVSSNLNAAGSGVEIEILIDEQHAGLVNTNSVFWNASGFKANLDVTDLKIDIESFEALIAGGIAFATRGAKGEVVDSGARFALLDEDPASSGSEKAARGRRFILVAEELTSIRKGDPVYYRRVEVGAVSHIELVADGSAVAAFILIEEQHVALVRRGSVFWNASGVHTDFSLLGASSLDVESLKALMAGGIAFGNPADGSGAAAAADTEFRLFSEVEAKERLQAKPRGLNLVLTGDKLGSIAVGNAVYYREVPVGEVTSVGLDDNGSSAVIHAVIRRRYAPLVQEGTVFWNASGVHAKFGLFSGAEINVESLKALLAGGVAFATPQTSGGTQARKGSHFVLHDKPQDEWLAWRPAVRLAPEESKAHLPRLPQIHDPSTAAFSVDDLLPAANTTRAAANVRNGPGTRYRVIDTLPRGTTVEVTGKVSGLDWYRVRMAGGREAYIWSKLLEPGGSTGAN